MISIHTLLLLLHALPHRFGSFCLVPIFSLQGVLITVVYVYFATLRVPKQGNLQTLSGLMPALIVFPLCPAMALFGSIVPA